MSGSEHDSDVVELALDLAGLQITVRGSSTQAADFVRRVATGSVPAPAAPSSSAGFQPSQVPASTSPTSTARSTTSETRRTIQASFEECPARLIALAERNLSASRLPPAQRGRRAWLAGKWARAVLDQRVSSPNASEALDLGNRYWVVLRSSRCSCPRIFTSSGAFFAAVGQISGSNTVCQAFPSETEAIIYCEAADIIVPSQYN